MESLSAFVPVTVAGRPAEWKQETQSASKASVPSGASRGEDRFCCVSFYSQHLAWMSIYRWWPRTQMRSEPFPSWICFIFVVVSLRPLYSVRQNEDSWLVYETVVPSSRHTGARWGTKVSAQHLCHLQWGRSGSKVGILLRGYTSTFCVHSGYRNTCFPPWELSVQTEGKTLLGHEKNPE